MGTRRRNFLDDIQDEEPHFEVDFAPAVFYLFPTVVENLHTMDIYYSTAFKLFQGRKTSLRYVRVNLLLPNVKCMQLCYQRPACVWLVILV
jgi:hypothetical protein